MNELQEWLEMNNQIRLFTKSLSASTKSKMNDAVFQQLSTIMKQESLSLIYGKYGEQLYEKTPNVMDYISVKKSGFDTLLNVDDSKLIKTMHTDDLFNTDFINYGSLPNIERQDVKYNMGLWTDFENSNSYLYKIQEQKQRKNEVLKDGLNKMKVWFNSMGQEQFLKFDKNFSGKLK